MERRAWGLSVLAGADENQALLETAPNLNEANLKGVSLKWMLKMVIGVTIFCIAAFSLSPAAMLDKGDNEKASMLELRMNRFSFDRLKDRVCEYADAQLAAKSKKDECLQWVERWQYRFEQNINADGIQSLVIDNLKALQDLLKTGNLKFHDFQEGALSLLNTNGRISVEGDEKEELLMKNGKFETKYNTILSTLQTSIDHAITQKWLIEIRVWLKSQTNFSRISKDDEGDFVGKLKDIEELLDGSKKVELMELVNDLNSCMKPLENDQGLAEHNVNVSFTKSECSLDWGKRVKYEFDGKYKTYMDNIKGEVSSLIGRFKKECKESNVAWIKTWLEVFQKEMSTSEFQVEVEDLKDIVSLLESDNFDCKDLAPKLGKIVPVPDDVFTGEITLKSQGKFDTKYDAVLTKTLGCVKDTLYINWLHKISISNRLDSLEPAADDGELFSLYECLQEEYSLETLQKLFGHESDSILDEKMINHGGRGSSLQLEPSKTIVAAAHKRIGIFYLSSWIKYITRQVNSGKMIDYESPLQVLSELSDQLNSSALLSANQLSILVSACLDHKSYDYWVGNIPRSLGEYEIYMAGAFENPIGALKTAVNDAKKRELINIMLKGFHKLNSDPCRYIKERFITTEKDLEREVSLLSSFIVAVNERNTDQMINVLPNIISETKREHLDAMKILNESESESESVTECFERLRAEVSTFHSYFSYWKWLFNAATAVSKKKDELKSLLIHNKNLQQLKNVLKSQPHKHKDSLDFLFEPDVKILESGYDGDVDDFLKIQQPLEPTLKYLETTVDEVLECQSKMFLRINKNPEECVTTWLRTIMQECDRRTEDEDFSQAFQYKHKEMCELIKVVHGDDDECTLKAKIEILNAAVKDQGNFLDINEKFSNWKNINLGEEEVKKVTVILNESAQKLLSKLTQNFVTSLDEDKQKQVSKAMENGEISKAIEISGEEITAIPNDESASAGWFFILCLVRLGFFEDEKSAASLLQMFTLI